jgi:hypothetical protein
MEDSGKLMEDRGEWIGERGKRKVGNASVL